MSRMTGKTRVVIGGVDTHADTHEAAVLDERGRLLAVEGFPTTATGYQQLLDWMRGFGVVREIGVESSGAYGAGLTRHLLAAGVKVLEVNRPHAHTRNRRGKNDAIDAEAAARKVLAGECTAIPKDTTGIVEAIRQLLLARASAVHARAAAMHQLGELVVTAPAEVRQSLTAKTLPGKASQATRWRPDPARLADPAQAARMALRSIGRRIHTLGEEIKLRVINLQALNFVALGQDHRPTATCPARRGLRNRRPAAHHRRRQPPTDCAPKPPSPASAASPRSQPAAAKPTATASAEAATARPTEPYT